MKVIITGGTGLIGRTLANRLREDQHEVILLTRSPNRPVQGLAKGITLHGWDGRTSQGWESVAEGSLAIVNLAGENLAAGLWTEERKRRILESRRQAGLAVAQAVQAVARKPQVVIQSSAVGYYGPRPDDRVPETTPSGNDFLSQVCREWEASSEAVESLGVRRVVIRTGVVLDPSEGALPRMALPFRLFAGGPLGSGKQGLPWIHLQDEIEAIRFLMFNLNSHGAYNLSAPHPVSNAQFGRILGKILGRPYWIPAPAFALRLILGEMSTVVLEGQRAVPDRLLAEGFKFRFPTLEAALNDLYQNPRKAA